MPDDDDNKHPYDTWPPPPKKEKPLKDEPRNPSYIKPEIIPDDPSVYEIDEQEINQEEEKNDDTNSKNQRDKK